MSRHVLLNQYRELGKVVRLIGREKRFPTNSEFAIIKRAHKLAAKYKDTVFVNLIRDSITSARYAHSTGQSGHSHPADCAFCETGGDA